MAKTAKNPKMTNFPAKPKPLANRLRFDDFEIASREPFLRVIFGVIFDPSKA